MKKIIFLTAILLIAVSGYCGIWQFAGAIKSDLPAGWNGAIVTFTVTQSPNLYLVSYTDITSYQPSPYGPGAVGIFDASGEYTYSGPVIIRVVVTKTGIPGYYLGTYTYWRTFYPGNSYSLYPEVPLIYYSGNPNG